jgi:hypothetical protein
VKPHGSQNPDIVEAEYLYFRLYNSYLLRTPDLQQNYEMLVDLWQKCPSAFSILSERDLHRLKQVQEDIQKNQYTLFKTDLLVSEGSEIGTEKLNRKHQDICREIIQHPQILEPYTGSINFLNIEHPVWFGAIDILALSNDIAYIIEVKTTMADYTISGQVMKYFIGLSLNLAQKWYEDVQIITICPGYEQVARLQLGQIGATTLIFSDNPLKLKRL